MSAEPARKLAEAPRTDRPRLSVCKPDESLELPFGDTPPVLSYDTSASIDVTIFVACYNEEENIIDTLDTVVAVMDDVGCSYEVIVVDDASTDASVELVEEYRRQHPELPILLKVNRKNRGLGRNFVDAAFMGRGKYYRLVCGDNVETCEKLVHVLGHMGQADLVLPYHEFCEGRSNGRRLLSRTYTRIINFLSGNRVRYYNGCALYLRFHVMRWHSQTGGFGFQADLVTQLLDEGVNHLEIHDPYAKDRTKGTARALTLRNLCSVGHVMLLILIRRLRRAWLG
ncbi:MAG: glycosyltransferase family 2 protein [Pirellulaceae bacterium]